MDSKSLLKELKAVNLVFERETLETKLALDEIPILSQGRLSPREVFDLFWLELSTCKKDPLSAYRYKFWEPYLQAGLVQDCTLALTREAFISISKEKQPFSWQYSCLKKDKHSISGEALLLMQFEKILVAEWKYNGKCYIWKKKNLHMPVLNLDFYQRKNLCKFPDHIQQHYFSKEGRWQKDLSLFLKEIIIPAR